MFKFFAINILDMECVLLYACRTLGNNRQQRSIMSWMDRLEDGITELAEENKQLKEQVIEQRALVEALEKITGKRADYINRGLPTELCNAAREALKLAKEHYV